MKIPINLNEEINVKLTDHRGNRNGGNGMISADERNYYRDIHSINKSLESIAKSLNYISQATKQRQEGKSETEDVYTKYMEALRTYVDSSRENTEL